MTDQQRPTWAVRLQTEREARGWSKHEMARQLLRADGLQRGSVSNIARQILDHEKGIHFPRDWASAYAVAFETDVAALFPSLGASGASFSHEPHLDLEDDVKRRTLLGLLATAAVAAPLGQEAEPLRASLTETVITGVTDRDADAWERVAFDYAHEIGQLPTAVVLPDLLTDFTEINLLISRAIGSARLRLIHAAAQLAALTAIALTNLGDPRSARRWWRTAARTADESGDHLVAALVRGRQAVFSLYEDRSHLAVLNVADEAIEVGRNQPCTGVVSGYAAKAQALAQFGRHQEAGEALEDLQSLFERLPAHVCDDRGSQWGWSAQRFHHVASHVHTFAGAIDRAGEAQDQALMLYPRGNYQGRTQVELHRAGCLLRAGDVDEGARHTVRVLEGLPAELSKDGLLRRTALVSLGMAPAAAATSRPALREAYELLAQTPGQG